MGYHILHLTHVIGVIFLTAITFAAFAAPQQERRKKMLMWSGIASLVVFLAGFGLLGVMKLGFPIWAITKIVCWLILSALAGLAFRNPQKISTYVLLSIIVVTVAVFMVELRPV